MEPSNGHPCPECGAPRQRDNTPACACTHRAAEALRDARTAQAAAAEDFDPLRIRPYVEIDAGPSGGPGGGTARAADEGRPTPPAGAPTPPLPGESTGASSEGTPRPAAEDDSAALPYGDTPQPPGNGSAQTPRAQGRTAEGARPAATDNRATPPYGTAPRPPGNGSAEASRAQGPGEPAAAGTPGPAAATDSAGSSLPHTEAPRPGSAAPPPSPADATMPLRPVEPDATTVLPAAAPVTAALPTPLAPAPTEPSVTDLRMFDGTAGADRGAAEAGGPGARRPGRRRRNLLVAAAAACVAVVAAAGYASGLFSYESPSRDTALPDDIRASVPDAPSSSAASTPPQGSSSAAPPAPAAPPSPSRSGSPSASPSPSAPSASASPSQSPSPSAPQPSGSATGPEQAPPGNGRQKAGPTVLRLGDRGPEVTELQLRLRQLYLYDDDTDGTFDDRLADAVRTYQWSRGVQADELGVYDRETREKLESETREP
ncbi:peptidoglycan-binding protein [Streptomyces massasporeus]|uniref:peptidoglycan-binding protein n=1 Tax=Streptomyces massasporeus TaxID=67324 RepID=UPI003454C707